VEIIYGENFSKRSCSREESYSLKEALNLQMFFQGKE
jgi:hypothetical protein